MDQAPVDDPENEQALKNYFKGVDFPAGSQIVYDSRINRLIVTNTPENLQKIDEIVNELLKQQDPMIQIMAKFIEISQNDLDELAFNYQLSVNSAVSATSAAGDGKYTATRGTIPPPITPSCCGRWKIYRHAEDPLGRGFQCADALLQDRYR